MLDMRKLALATGALLGLGLSQTFAVNPVLVKILEQKGILTEEETQKVLSAGERGDIVLAEILKEKGILTEEETQKVIATAPKKTAKPTEEFSKSELKRLKNLAGLKIGGVAYLHYDYNLHGTKKSKDDSNEFKVTRAYLEIRKYFDKNNNSRYFRLTLDVFKDEPKDGYQARLKYAYLNWDITPYLQTEIGLAHRPAIDWIEHHLWKHRYMEKTFYFY
jgi:hypothetical protein